MLANTSSTYICSCFPSADIEERILGNVSVSFRAMNQQMNNPINPRTRLRLICLTIQINLKLVYYAFMSTNMIPQINNENKPILILLEFGGKRTFIYILSTKVTVCLKREWVRNLCGKGDEECGDTGDSVVIHDFASTQSPV